MKNLLVHLYKSLTVLVLVSCFSKSHLDDANSKGIYKSYGGTSLISRKILMVSLAGMTGTVSQNQTCVEPVQVKEIFEHSLAVFSCVIRVCNSIVVRPSILSQNVGVDRLRFPLSVITDLDQVICWGNNLDISLGISGTDSIGHQLGEMGGNLTAVNVGDDFMPKKISSVIFDTFSSSTLGGLVPFLCQNPVSDQHSGILHNLNYRPTLGKIKNRGENLFGHLSYRRTDDIGNEAGEMGNNLRIVDPGNNYTATQVICGEEHTYALLSSGRIKCWGGNFGNGFLGLGDTDNRGDNPVEMVDSLTIVYLVQNYSAPDVSVCSSSCTILDTKELKWWGQGNSVQRCQGSRENIDNDPNQMCEKLIAIALGVNLTLNQVFIALQHVCSQLNPGEIKFFGGTSVVELGLGDTDNRGDGPVEMGDNLTTQNLGLRNCPTPTPTQEPTMDPTQNPSIDPTSDPTSDPTADPTSDPTSYPTKAPTSDPTADPTTDPSIYPTVNPNGNPTINPVESELNPDSSDSSESSENSESFSERLSDTFGLENETRAVWIFVGILIVDICLAMSCIAALVYLIITYFKNINEVPFIPLN